MNIRSQSSSVEDEELRIFPQHIDINFVPDQADRLKFIVDKLKKYNFASTKERALVFVARRQDAEDNAANFSALSGYSADYYHAGRDSGEKEDVAARFKKGDIAVLFATKAFGMGIDIDNICYVFHMTPPSSIEDYVQEIGRARPPKKETEPCKPQAFLLHSDSNFNDARSRQIKSQLHWSMVKKMHSLLGDYRSQLTLAERNSFVIPADLIVRESLLSENLFGRNAASVRQRMLLHSLEEAQRIEVGNFELTYWPVALGATNSEDKNVCEIRKIAEERGATREAATLIAERVLREKLGLDSDHEAREHLFWAAKIGAIRIPFELVIEPTRWVQDESNKPYIAEVQKRADRFFRYIRAIEGETCTISHKKIHTSATTHDAKNTKQHEENTGKSRFNERKLNLMRFLRHIEGLRVVNDKKQGKYDIFGSDKVNWRDTLEQLPDRAKCIVEYLRVDKLDNNEKPVTTIDELYKVAGAGFDRMRLKDLELTLYYLAALGIVRLVNDFIPTSVRVEVSADGFDSPFDTSYDEEAREKLKERNRLRTCRLDALQVLTRCESAEAREPFARDFFNSKSVDNTRQILLKKAMEVDTELHRQFADVALEEYYEKLTGEQKKVVCASQTKNLVVEAGPGTGKTHTLISCFVQRLIASERIEEGRHPGGPVHARDILVLAYTRAVVEELRHRIGKLLNLLGRKEAPHIHTFHSYALTKLREQGQDNIDLEQAIPRFIEQFEGTAIPNAPAHIFVDEFQDISEVRARMLKTIIKSKDSALVTVIGDPNQSIYEYNKNKLRQQSFNAKPTSSKAYFRSFKKNFDASELSLSVNFRCDKQIVKYSQTILKHDSEHGLNPRDDAGEGEIIVASSEDKPLSHYAAEALKLHRQVAILFRTNSELYTAMDELRETQKQMPGLTLRILGGKGKIVYSREINTILEAMDEDHANEPCCKELVQEIVDKEWEKAKHVWAERLCQHLLDGVGLFLENNPNSSVTDFIDWVRDDKEGHHLLYASMLQRIDNGKKEIVLSTMHRTKGLEFDAVIIAPSNMTLKHDDIEEEERLRYVAVTRTKHKLVLVDGPRENALRERRAWAGEENQRGERFDSIDAEGRGAFTLFKFAEYEKYILENIMEGDPLRIERNVLLHNGKRICIIAEKRIGTLPQQPLEGIFVSEVVRHDDNEYIDHCAEEIRQRGWYYVVNAAGYLKSSPKNK